MKRKYDLWLVLIILFLNRIGVGLVFPLFSVMLFGQNLLVGPEVSAEARGWYLVTLLSIMSVAQFFSAPIFGAKSDQLGRKPLLLLALILTIAGYAVCAIGVLYQSILLLILGRIVIGVGAGSVSVISAVVADLSTPETKAKHYGLMSMASGAGFTVGPFLGGNLSQFGFSIPFFIAGCAVFFNFILVYFGFKETFSVKKLSKVRIHEGLKNITRAFKIPGLKVIFLAVFFYCLGWIFFDEFIPVTWIADYRFNSSQIGNYYAFSAAVYALSSGVLIRPIVNRFKHYTVFFYALIALGIVILCMLSDPKKEWIWVYLALINFLISLLFPTSSAIVSDSASREDQGKTLGMLQSVQAAAFAFSPLAAGSFLGSHPHMPILVSGISMFIAALILGILSRKDIFKGTCRLR